MSNSVVITVNMAWNLINFRANLIRGLLGAGYEVVALAPNDRHASRVRELGCRFIHLPMDNMGTNPLRDLLLLWRYFRLFRKIRPVAMLGFTIKPNVYGSIAARWLGIPVVNNIAGLGKTFLHEGWLNRVARVLYRIALSCSRRVFFQNQDDLNLFVENGLVREDKAARLPGSGVDTAHFAPQAVSTQTDSAFRFLLLARLIWDKGVGEYIEAVRILRDAGMKVDARLLGFLDVRNPAAISRKQVESWQAEGMVTYLGDANDVRPHLAAVDCVVLPSYREGAPRSLLEAASMAKPVITSDVPGCRDVVLAGKTGYLVPAKDPRALADAMQRMARLPVEEREKMGKAARQFVVDKYDERKVVEAYIAVMRDISSYPFRSC